MSQQPVRKLGIRFGDNDFGNCITAWLRAIANVGLKEYKFDNNKQKVADLFNRSMPGFYWTCQNLLEYQTDWDAGEYLNIDVDRVYFDDEVDDYLKRGSCDSDFFVLDTTPYEGPYVYSA
jgi:hypothetical protein